MQQNIVILTGAGISAESGLQTFRAEDGLWCEHRVEDVATPEAFERDPALVQQFYNLRRAQLAEAAPNPAHIALAELAAQNPGDTLIVTQNVDDLHDRALLRAALDPSVHLIHMHGELLKARHVTTGVIRDQRDDLPAESDWRPHIVWFGEMPLEMDRIYRALRNCDLFISIGTSGNVYPAAGFVFEASRCGAQTIELNLEPSAGANLFERHIYGPASQVVPDFIATLEISAKASQSP